MSARPQDAQAGALAARIREAVARAEGEGSTHVVLLLSLTDASATADALDAARGSASDDPVRLRKLLDRYGQHDRTCPLWGVMTAYMYPERCGCGFSTALDAAGGAAPDGADHAAWLTRQADEMERAGATALAGRLRGAAAHIGALERDRDEALMLASGPGTLRDLAASFLDAQSRVNDAAGRERARCSAPADAADVPMLRALAEWLAVTTRDDNEYADERLRDSARLHALADALAKITADHIDAVCAGSDWNAMKLRRELAQILGEVLR